MIAGVIDNGHRPCAGTCLIARAAAMSDWFRERSSKRGAWTMSLEQTLRKVVGHIRADRLENEAQVQQAVILPVLRALGWDDSDPESFRPEYSVGGGRVDYALLGRGGPLVFIEAKRIGAADAGGEEQLFGYAANQGVPLLVLTDGDRWDFYLAMAAGIPEKRRFHRLELLRLEQKTDGYVDFLEKHLRKDRVVSGAARRSAEELHESNRERERAREAILPAWRTLLQEPDELLCDLLAEKVEGECGTKPELDDIEAFLKNLSSTPMRPESGSGRVSLSPDPATPRPGFPPRARTKIVGFVLGEERVETGTAIRTLIKLLPRLGRDDPDFMDRFASKTAGRRRSLVARDRAALYRMSHHLVDTSSTDLGNGWWLGTNLSTGRIRKHIETACDVAGIKFGSQLKLIER